MGRAYSQDFRERVLAEVDDGTPVYDAAGFYRVSVSFIYKLLMRRAKTGQTAPATVRGRPPRKLAGHEEDGDIYRRVARRRHNRAVRS